MRALIQFSRRCVSNVVGVRAMRAMMQQPNAVVYDVRNASEIAATGVLQHGGTTAQNVPLPEVTPQTFKDLEPESSILIFSCAAGVRSLKAAGIAEAAGFKHCYNYLGGANEWFCPQS